MPANQESGDIDLSICIPTYNRAAYLDLLLESINLQTSDISHEVLVCDNASSDTTRLVFEKHSRGRSNWHFRQNQANLGGRTNIRLCTKDAKGEWVYIVGDDDKLKPDIFTTLGQLICFAKTHEAGAIIAFDGFNNNYPVPRLLDSGFEWLQDVSINVPAFISNVIWRKSFWNSYDYYGYPKEMSLPQLDCFIDACIGSKVIVVGQSLVEIGHAESAGDLDYWFFKRHALVDCFEYPLLYDKVLQSGKPSIKTSVVIHARRLFLLRHIFKKINFMKYNYSYYKPNIDDFRKIHGSKFYWPLLLIYLTIILNTFVGNIVSNKQFENNSKLAEPDCKDNQF